MSDLAMEFGKFNTCHDERGKFCSGSTYSRIQAVKELAAKDPRVAEAEKLNREGGDSRDWPGVQKDGHYTPKAHAENMSIADSFMNPAAKTKEGEAPIAIILLGKPGAGKTTVVKSMGNTIQTTMINSDDIKDKIPGHKPNMAQVTHERSCDIARNYLAPAAIEARHNITFDMTDNQDRVLKMAAELKAKGYKIGVIHVDVDNATSAERVYSRFQHTGRYVPVQVALSYGDKPEKSYRALKSSGLVDQWRKYDNSSYGKPPKQLDAGGKEVFKRGAVGSLGAGFGGWSSNGTTALDKGNGSPFGQEDRGFGEDLAQKFGKFNSNHDHLGRFASGSSGGEVTGSGTVPLRESQDKAIEDIKQELQMVSSLTGGKGSQAFVLEHGQPFYMNDKTFSGPRSPQKECYKNATQKVLADRDSTYVEGFVHIGPLALHHAWTVDKQGNVVDPTLKANTGSVSPRGYFGVPFKRSYVEDTMAKTRVYGIISHTNRSLFEGDASTAVGFGKSNTCHVSSGDKGGQFCSTGGGQSGLAAAPSNREDWPEHIKALKIPPAWKDVKIDPDPKAALQVVGKDSAGRVQYVYSKSFQDSQAAAKFARIKELDAKFDKIRAENQRNMKSDDPRVREHAECASLVMSMGVRPGSDADTGAKIKAYGATTLLGKHIVEDGGQVRLRFIGKKGVNLDLPVEDRGLASMLKSRATRSGAGEPLFPQISGSSLLEYTHTLNGGKFKTKDFRTLTGTREAMNQIKGMKPPANTKEYKKSVMSVAKTVATKLGNTPTVALQSYINPSVFSSWRFANAI